LTKLTILDETMFLDEIIFTFKYIKEHLIIKKSHYMGNFKNAASTLS